MDILKGLTKEEAIKAGMLVPINLTDPNWLEKLFDEAPKEKVVIKKKK